jgi:hypothetical protein
MSYHRYYGFAKIIIYFILGVIMKDIALITLHGMGLEKPNYSDKLEEKLRKELAGSWSRVCFKSIHYAPILQEPQDQLWRSMIAEPKNDLDYIKLRKFFLFGFGDAASLEYSAHHENEAYQKVQKLILDTLREAYIALGQDCSKPVIIVAHSLGCQVISNYVWDAQNKKQIFLNMNDYDENESSFLCLQSLQQLTTTGCNIPLFISGIKKRTCFETPNDQFVWDNYYDPDDVLGWPLRQLSTSYEIVTDHDVSVGGVFSSWNPLSHSEYWTDRDVVNPLISRLHNLLALNR